MKMSSEEAQQEIADLRDSTMGLAAEAMGRGLSFSAALSAVFSGSVDVGLTCGNPDVLASFLHKAVDLSLYPSRRTDEAQAELSAAGDLVAQELSDLAAEVTKHGLPPFEALKRARQDEIGGAA